MTLHFDRKQVRRAFGRAAGSYEAHAVLQREVESRLLERLDLLKKPPLRVLDVGCGTGHATAQLRKRYRHAQVLALDFALPMLKQARRRSGWWNPFACVCADASCLPVLDGGIDLLFCNLCLQWCDNLDATLKEFRRVLSTDGLLLVSTFGQDTLHELRSAWSAVDDKPHVSPFIDIQQFGNALLATGFSDPVLDLERFTLTYKDTFALMRDLKGIGASNASNGRSRALTGKSHMQRMFDAYETFRRDDLLPATYEVIYAQAFAPKPGQPLRSENGEIARFPVENLRGTRR